MHDCLQWTSQWRPGQIRGVQGEGSRAMQSRRRRHARRRVFTEGKDERQQRLRQSLERITSQTEFVAETMLPTRHGLFRLRGYRHTLDDWRTFTEPTAIIKGEIEGRSKVPLRVHDACYTSEVLGSLKCDCAEQLEIALEYIQENPPGLVIYLQQEGRGIGLTNKIAAYALQESGLDTVEANRALGFPDDCREYTPVPNILKDLDIKSTRLMTNNPRKLKFIENLGVRIVDRIPCLVQPGAYNQKYLEVKEKKMDHLLDGSWCFWDHDGESIGPSAGNNFSSSSDSDQQS